MSSYHKLNEFLKKNNLKKENIIKSESYKYISNYFDKDHIYFSKILSMSLEKSPKMIRIRNDNFLIDAVEKKENSILIVGFKYENKEKILIFSNEIYFDYNQSVRSSNSIITFNSDLFFNFFKNDNNGSMLKISKLNKEKINVSFYITDIDEIDEVCFKEFITKKKECKIQSDSESIDNPSIPKKYKDEVFINFNNNNFECSLRFIDEKFCRCKLQKPYEKEDNQFHHFIPRNYFKKLYMNDSLKVLNWDEIHKPINLIPICYYCHKDIHSSKKNLEKSNEKFNQILKIYKQYDYYDNFIDYMKKNTTLESIEDLRKFYIEDNEDDMKKD